MEKVDKDNYKDPEDYIYNQKIFKKNSSIIKKYVKVHPKKEKIYKNGKIIKLLKILRRKIKNKDKYLRRLTKEFSLIIKFGFEEVFYQVNEIIILAENLPHIIRGSAGSCLLCYLMGITNIDPIENNIALSRFMHKDRPDIPDIDIDFPASHRDEIYKKIFTKWEDKVARISNHNMYKKKSAYREAIRKEGYRKFVPKNYKLSDIFPDNEQIKNVKRNAKLLLGKLRCHSLHCGGIVIFSSKVPDELKLKYYDIDNNVKGLQLKLNKDEVEDSNMIKIDVLSNRGLSQLWDISEHEISRYPLNDTNTLELLSEGNNIGLTHAESRAMMKVFRTMKPKTIKEIAIGLALIRPAAAKNHQKCEFLKDYTPDKYTSKDYLIFDDDATLGIKRILKCSDSEADQYRRAFAKNKTDIKRKFKRKLNGLKDLDQENKDRIIERLELLEYYSFCKSHAFSYAQLVWALAYHKANNPKEFWLSTLNNCKTSYRKWVHYREANKAGIELTIGSSPYELDENNKLIPKKVPKNKIKTQVGQLFKYGYWESKEFIPGMYYREYFVKKTKFHKNLRHAIIENKKIKYAIFKGIIATGRGYRKEGCRGYCTFVTISSADGVYHDLVLYGYQRINKMTFISGFGILRDDGYCRWIDVISFRKEYINNE